MMYETFHRIYLSYLDYSSELCLEACDVTMRPSHLQLLQMTTEASNTLKSSRAEVWDLKTISFGAGQSRRDVKIITQNFNGFVIRTHFDATRPFTRRRLSAHVRLSQSVCFALCSVFKADLFRRQHSCPSRKHRNITS